MKLKFKTDYKSIRSLPAAELPEFTILSGPNGSGKTHFLEAIVGGSIEVEDVSKEQIQYYNWTTLAPADDQAVTLVAIAEERNQHWQTTSQIFDQIRRDALGSLRNLRIPELEGLDFLDIVTSASQGSPVALSETNAKKVLDILESQSKRGRIAPPLSILWKHLEQRIGLPILAINEDRFFEEYPLVIQEANPFQTSFTRLFAAYARARELNDLRALRSGRGENVDYLNDNEFEATYGPPPWIALNQVLVEAGLPFRVQEPPDDSTRPYSARLFHNIANQELKFADLSSGERILASIGLFLFYSADERQPTRMPYLLLLDEVDAPLHPSMTLGLLRTLQRVIVEQYHRRVIMATHAPSTIALGPEDAIHVMDHATRQIHKASRDEAVRALTVGVPTLSIRLENRRQIFVESFYDVFFYDRIAMLLQAHLLPQISLAFLAAGNHKDGGCQRVRHLVQDLFVTGIQTVFGIVDWDLTNDPSEHVHVLGHGVRYSIENYILDPILLSALLLRDKLIDRNELGLTEGETYVDLRSFDNSRLQVVANHLLKIMGWMSQKGAEMVRCEFVNGRSIDLPREFLKKKGHGLEAELRTHFEGLKKYHQEDQLKREVLEKIADDLPGFVSADILSILKSIQEHGI